MLMEDLWKLTEGLQRLTEGLRSVCLFILAEYPPLILKDDSTKTTTLSFNAFMSCYLCSIRMLVSNASSTISMCGESD